MNINGQNPRWRPFFINKLVIIMRAWVQVGVHIPFRRNFAMFQSYRSKELRKTWVRFRDLVDKIFMGANI